MNWCKEDPTNCPDVVIDAVETNKQDDVKAEKTTKAGSKATKANKSSKGAKAAELKSNKATKANSKATKANKTAKGSKADDLKDEKKTKGLSKATKANKVAKGQNVSLFGSQPFATCISTSQLLDTVFCFAQPFTHIAPLFSCKYMAKRLTTSKHRIL